MKIARSKQYTAYLFDTPVENIFINEYMPLAPEGYVKVYLFARMYEGQGQELTEETIARALSMETGDVEKALSYWAKAGILLRDREGIRFISLKEQLYGSANTPPPSGEGRQLLDNQELKRILDGLQQTLGIFFSGGDIHEIASWVDDLKATEQVILGAGAYCAKKGKTNIRYVGSVVRSWTGKGLATAEDVNRYLEDLDQNHYACRRVMRALGFHRGATEEEQRIISSWLDDLGCTMDEILEACSKTSGIPNPNINYVNAILTRTRGIDPSSGEVSSATVREYYQSLREKAEEDARARRREIQQRIPQLAKIEAEMIDCNRSLTQLLVAGGQDKLEQMSQVRQRLDRLEREKAVRMTEADIPIDYGDVRYRCERCGDTGVMEDGSRCECYLERSAEARLWKR